MAEIHLNFKEISRILLSEDMRKRVDEVAARIAAAADTSPVPDATVSTLAYTTDRVGVAISITHPAGMAMEAKYGTLRRAAASQGLEVTSDKQGG